MTESPETPQVDEPAPSEEPGGPPSEPEVPAPDEGGGDGGEGGGGEGGGGEGF